VKFEYRKPDASQLGRVGFWPNCLKPSRGG